MDAHVTPRSLAAVTDAQTVIRHPLPTAIPWTAGGHERGGWNDPHGAEARRRVLAAAGGSAALTLTVLASLVLVSLAAARPSFLSPIGRRGPYPSWLAGPLGPITSWFNPGGRGLDIAFEVLVGTMYLCYLIAVWAAPRLRARWVIAAIVLVHLIFLLAPPMQLTDIFNYINYGRMEVFHGLNPYTTIPALEPSSDPAFALSNWHGLLSPYGPLFTLVTLAVVPLGLAGSFWTLKVLLVVLSLGIVWLVWRCAELLGRTPLTAAVFVGLNPIVLVWGLGGDHNDFFMLFFVVLAVYLLLRAESARIGLRAPPPAAPVGLARRAVALIDGIPRPLADGEPAPWMEIGAGVALAAAVGIKASAAVLVPVMVLGARRRLRFSFGLLVGLGLALAATVLAFGLNLPNLAQQDSLVVPTGIPNLVGYILGLGGENASLHAVLEDVLIVGVAACALWAARTRRWITACGGAFLFLLLTLSWMLPSYLMWLLPFAALTRTRWQRVAATLFACYVFVFWMPFSTSVESFLHLDVSNTMLSQQLTNFERTLEF